ncbi:hypothetical protein B0H11DRAFT_2291180 [Mycena galericulata]|nr:hypothetical protein B0H11DRAFT_2291180 [Mycena galericulata]
MQKYRAGLRKLTFEKQVENRSTRKGGVTPDRSLKLVFIMYFTHPDLWIAIAMAQDESSSLPEDASTVVTGFVSFLQLPPELVLEICDYLSNPELLTFCQVSCIAAHIGFSAIFARYGILEHQIQSRELLANFPPCALHALSAAYPTVIPNIKLLNLNFTNEVDHVRVWRSLIRLGENLPVIPRITLTFSEPAEDLSRFIGNGYPPFWTRLPVALVALLGDLSKPVIIINNSSVQPKTVVRPSALSRVLSPRAIPKIDKERLKQRLLHSMQISKRQPVSCIHLQSFPEPTAPLGSVVVMNPASISCLSLEDVLYPAEWHFILPRLNLPCLSFLFIYIDLEWNPLAVFLGNHQKIESLVFKSDRSCLEPQEPAQVSVSALPHLSQLYAGPRVVARLLQTYELPLLHRVCIEPDPNTSTYFPEALRAIAAHTSVTSLDFSLRRLSPPWIDFDANQGRVEPELRYIRTMAISSWPHQADHTALPIWLAMFPSLQILCISGRIAEGQVLLSERIVDAVKATCPHILRFSQSPRPLLVN